MSAGWYIVKRNWPATSAIQPRFAGVGGDIWPLDDVSDAIASGFHRKLIASRQHRKVGQCTELLCLDRIQADVYFWETERLGGNAWLLELIEGADANNQVDGFDVGFPSGGGSIVESELIVQGLDGPLLNRWGLISSVAEAMMYIDQRAECRDLEEADGVALLAVRVLRHPAMP